MLGQVPSRRHSIFECERGTSLNLGIDSNLLYLSNADFLDHDREVTSVRLLDLVIEKVYDDVLDSFRDDDDDKDIRKSKKKDKKKKNQKWKRWK